MLWSPQQCPRRDEHIEVCASFDGEPDVIEIRAALVESFARMLRVLIEADHQAGRLVEQDGHRPLRKVDLPSASQSENPLVPAGAHLDVRYGQVEMPDPYEPGSSMLLTLSLVPLTPGAPVILGCPDHAVAPGRAGSGRRRRRFRRARRAAPLR